MNTVANSYNKVTDLLNTLASIRGEGGRESKRRKFAENGMEVIATGQRPRCFTFISFTDEVVIVADMAMSFAD